MIHKTLRFQLTILSALAGILLFLVSGMVISYRHGKELLDSMDRDLVRIAKTEQPHSAPGAVEEAEIIRKMGDKYFRIASRDGKLTLEPIDGIQLWPVNREAVLKAFSGSPQFETVTYRGERYRTLYYPRDEVTVFRVGRSIEWIEKRISGLNGHFLSVSPFIIIFISIGSWVLLGKLLTPVAKIKTFAEQIGKGGLKERIRPDVKGKEVDELAQAFNKVLDYAESSVETLRRFASDVSHEIRSPLTSLRGAIEVTLKKKRTPEEYDEVLRNNLGDVIRLSRTIDNLLLLSRADNKVLALRRQWFDVQRLIGAIVDGFREKALAEGISIVEDCQNNLELNGDIDLLEQAFSNLIDNAVKYMPQGGTVTVETREEDAVIKVIIRDTGIGIPEEEIPHIFDRFYRVDKEHTKKFGGTGLGLAITHWIIKAHNGEILVASSIGKGSEFTVVLPKVPD